MKTWRDVARPIIADVITTCGYPHTANYETARKALRAAYPFQERKHWPYKVWLDECLRQLHVRVTVTNFDTRQIELWDVAETRTPRAAAAAAGLTRPARPVKPLDTTNPARQVKRMTPSKRRSGGRVNVAELRRATQSDREAHAAHVDDHHDGHSAS